MPFQSEKQRRYLWANEPEIARDWTNTYGSRIRKDNGGVAIQGGGPNYLGKQPEVTAPKYWQSSPDHAPAELAYITPEERDTLINLDIYGSLNGQPNRGPSGIMSLEGDLGGYDASPGGADSPGGGAGGGDQEAQNIAVQNAARTKAVLTGKIQKNPTTGNWEPGRNLGRGENVMGLGLGLGQGPKIGGGIGGGMKNFLGNWGSGVAGSKIGGGLGSMLFGPWGMLLGSIFGQGVGRRAYKASQTDKKETLRDIMLGQNTLLSNVLNKKKTPTPTDEGLGGIKNKFVDDYNYEPSEKMYFNEQQTSMPKNLGADISELENWMSENPQFVEQKHMNYMQALKNAQHNKALEGDPNRPGLRLSQLWE